MNNILGATRSHMQEALNLLRQDFATLRTGKASPALVENVEVNAYGGSARLRVVELATIHVQDPHTLIIAPFDHSVIGEIAKGIETASIGINPVVDESVIRINMPPLTEERRLEMVKLVSQKAEMGKVMLRQVRHEGMEEIKKQTDASGVSEDEITRLEKEVQRLTDEYVEKIDKLSSEKEQELMKL